MTPIDAVARQIGERIRRARITRGMTLQALAGAAGLSQAFLSRLERGQVSSSIANLIQITEALDIPLQSLFAAPEAEPARQGFTVYRSAEAGDLRTVESTGYRWLPVAGGGPDEQMEAFLLIFPCDRRSDVLVSHAGEEFCYVLEGEILFRIGEAQLRLRAGDGVHLRSDIPHMAENAGESEARILMVTASGRGGTAAFDWWRVPSAQLRPPQPEA
jgi:transcriptional regulator with XRE-family HTH domain